MTCVRCKTGITKKALVNVKLERDKSIVIVKNVPAQVCTECGEEYFTSEVTTKMHTVANKALGSGMEIAVVPLTKAA